MAKVAVKLYGSLRKTAYEEGVFDIQDDQTLREFLIKIADRVPALKAISNVNDIAKVGVWIFVNGMNVIHLNDKLDTKLKDGDTVSIIPAVVGG